MENSASKSSIVPRQDLRLASKAPCSCASVIPCSTQKLHSARRPTPLSSSTTVDLGRM